VNGLILKPIPRSHRISLRDSGGRIATPEQLPGSIIIRFVLDAATRSVIRQQKLCRSGLRAVGNRSSTRQEQQQQRSTYPAPLDAGPDPDEQLGALRAWNKSPYKLRTPLTRPEVRESHPLFVRLRRRRGTARLFWLTGLPSGPAAEPVTKPATLASAPAGRHPEQRWQIRNMRNVDAPTAPPNASAGNSANRQGAPASRQQEKTIGAVTSAAITARASVIASCRNSGLDPARNCQTLPGLLELR
jgi:hypothetical protein